MERLTGAALLSVIRSYIPYIFGEDAQELSPHVLGFTGFYPDLIVEVGENEIAIINVKTEAPNTTVRAEVAANQLLDYSRDIQVAYPTATIKRALITVGVLSASAKDHLLQLGMDLVITANDLQKMLAAGIIPPRITRSALNAAGSPEFRDEVRGHTVPEATAETFAQLLESTNPGRSTWAQYQKLAGDILEFLFCPELDRPTPELANQTGINRRDFIFPNNAVDGYWASLRSHYAAHFIVVDAKNFNDRVGKDEVLQMANYLSDHGTGLFGLITSRSGGKRDAEVTQQEQWVHHRKMIIILSDSDMKQMLAIRSSGGDPANLIRQKIEDFRLSF